MLKKVAIGLLLMIIFSALIGLIVNAIISAIPQPSNPQLSTAFNNTISNIKLTFSITDIEPIIFVIGMIISILAFLYMREE